MYTIVRQGLMQTTPPRNEGENFIYVIDCQLRPLQAIGKIHRISARQAGESSYNLKESFRLVVLFITRWSGVESGSFLK